MSDNPPVAPTPPPLQSRDPITRWWRGAGKTQKIVAGVVAAVIVMCCGCSGLVAALANSGGGNTSAAATSTSGSSVARATKAPAGTPLPTATPKPVFAHFDGDGIYQVGKDIQPGTYRTRNASSGCYYERLKSFDGSFNAIIANNTTDNPAIVTIAATDKGFHTEGCDTWTKDLSQITSSKTAFDDGMYIVGVDIAPGQYKSSATDSCYWERLKNFSNDFGGIIANDNTTTATIVTIKSTDKGFSSEGCGPWTKM